MGFQKGVQMGSRRGSSRGSRLSGPHFVPIPAREHRIMRHYSVELQTTNQTLATSKHSIEFTYSDFPCHLKVNRAR